MIFNCRWWSPVFRCAHLTGAPKFSVFWSQLCLVGTEIRRSRSEVPHTSAKKETKMETRKCANFATFFAAARENLLPLFRKTKISISPILVLAIFRTMCHFPPPHASWHLSSNTDLGEGERKGQSGPRMSGPSLGRQRQTRMR